MWPSEPLRIIIQDASWLIIGKMPFTYPHHPATAGNRLIIIRLVPVTKTATLALVTVTETATYTLVTVAPTFAPSPIRKSIPDFNYTGLLLCAVIWGFIIIIFYYKFVTMTKPKRKIKPTAKVQAGFDSSDGDDDMDDFHTTETAKAKPKPKSNKRQPKAKAKAKAAKSKSSEDELALTDDGDSEWEDDVEFLTTDPKSPFVSADLIVSLLSRCTSPEPTAFPHCPG